MIVCLWKLSSAPRVRSKLSHWEPQWTGRQWLRSREVDLLPEVCRFDPRPLNVQMSKSLNPEWGGQASMNEKLLKSALDKRDGQLLVPNLMTLSTTAGTAWWCQCQQYGTVKMAYFNRPAQTASTSWFVCFRTKNYGTEHARWWWDLVPKFSWAISS